ncbi:hypothetical protein LSUB1_G000211 [Lachnellula subtilissima]|uniref:Uncharacterized protein n=1 Tax=Lachnellula subtilissima TaxID=602034 RepID=A0A8H8UFK6_9HELO|nr:hypothetical protein LSUB1_G000211 [Lachnellula subtilissima]
MASSSSTLSREEVSAGVFGGPESLLPTSKAVLLPQLTNFLSLAPTTSASYPSSPRSKLPLPTTTLAPALAPENAGAEASPTIPEVLDMKIRRSSSSGSDESVSGSPTQRRRFLKLGPVHFGMDGDGKGDWSEEVIAE